MLPMAAAVSTGCFRYVPAELETAPPGEGVRVLMTSQGAAEFSSVTGSDAPAPLVNGTVVGVEGDDLLLSVSVGQRREGFIQSSLRQTVRVPIGEVLTFERRELDAVRTGVAVGGAAAVVAGVVVFIIKPFGQGDLGEEPPPDDLQFNLGLFSIPIGR